MTEIDFAVNIKESVPYTWWVVLCSPYLLFGTVLVLFSLGIVRRRLKGSVYPYPATILLVLAGFILCDLFAAIQEVCHLVNCNVMLSPTVASDLIRAITQSVITVVSAFAWILPVATIGLLGAFVLSFGDNGNSQKTTSTPLYHDEVVLKSKNVTSEQPTRKQGQAV